VCAVDRGPRTDQALGLPRELDRVAAVGVPQGFSGKVDRRAGRARERRERQGRGLPCAGGVGTDRAGILRDGQRGGALAERDRAAVVGKVERAAVQGHIRGIAQAVAVVGRGAVLQAQGGAVIDGEAAAGRDRAIGAGQDQRTVAHGGGAGIGVGCGEPPGAGAVLGQRGGPGPRADHAGNLADAVGRAGQRQGLGVAADRKVAGEDQFARAGVVERGVVAERQQAVGGLALAGIDQAAAVAGQLDDGRVAEVVAGGAHVADLRDLDRAGGVHQDVRAEVIVALENEGAGPAPHFEDTVADQIRFDGQGLAGRDVAVRAVLAGVGAQADGAAAFDRGVLRDIEGGAAQIVEVQVTVAANVDDAARAVDVEPGHTV